MNCEIEKDKLKGIEARLLATDDSDLDLEVREIPHKGRGVVVGPLFADLSKYQWDLCMYVYIVKENIDKMTN